MRWALKCSWNCFVESNVAVEVLEVEVDFVLPNFRTSLYLSVKFSYQDSPNEYSGKSISAISIISAWPRAWPWRL